MCGLKLRLDLKIIVLLLVTPFVGVWIETVLFCPISVSLEVTPFVGVWIETP